MNSTRRSRPSSGRGKGGGEGGHPCGQRTGWRKRCCSNTASGAGQTCPNTSPSRKAVATYVHTSAMGVGLTSLGHPLTGRKRPHNHYVIGDPADTTPTAHSVGTAGRRSPSTGDCGPPGGATEELLSTTLLGSLARGHKADYSGAARVQRFPAPPAADPTGNAGHRVEPRRSCSATTPSWHVGRRPRWGNCGPQYVPL